MHPTLSGFGLDVFTNDDAGTSTSRAMLQCLSLISRFGCFTLSSGHLDYRSVANMGKAIYTVGTLLSSA